MYAGLFDPYSKSVCVIDRAVQAGSITIAGGGSGEVLGPPPLKSTPQNQGGLKDVGRDAQSCAP
jgi:hypothetical protein